jgi:anaerobic magnesium-protoporphyrin IX monomethyl ester cyclase
MGAESGAQSVLDAMDKGTTVEQIKEASRLLKQYKIKVAYFLQFGYPGENMKDIKATLQLLDEGLPDDIGISVSYPLPGTAFYEKVKQELSKKSNWTDSDELALMFENAYPADFYKALHRYVHKHYRKQQSKAKWKLLFQGKVDWQAGDLRKLASLGYFLPAAWYHKFKLRNSVSEAGIL